MLIAEGGDDDKDDKWMRRWKPWIMTRLVKLINWIWKLISKIRWCIS